MMSVFKKVNDVGMTPCFTYFGDRSDFVLYIGRPNPHSQANEFARKQLTCVSLPIIKVHTWPVFAFVI